VHYQATRLMEGIPIPAGLLYYSQLDSVLRVEARPNEIRALIIARNELAHYLAKERSIVDASPTPIQSGNDDDEIESFLPPTIDNPRECKTCYAVDSCMLYRKASFRVVQKSD
jgi:DNA replication ATP-dependent helicase Dna2